jgi:hypothetical protein
VVLVGAGLFGLAGNMLHPRYAGEDVDIYRHIAASDRYAVADLVLVPALVLLTIGLAALARRASGSLGDIARIVALIGGALGVAEIVVELQGVRQQAKLFVSAMPGDRPGAFWSTNAIDRINGALTGGWVILLLGVAPLLLGAIQLTDRAMPRVVALAGCAGGAVGAVVGVIDLLSSDQGRANLAFLIGSLVVTGWVIATGFVLTRTSGGAVRSGLDRDTR